MASKKANPKASGAKVEAREGNRVKDPGDRTTGGEPMTEARESYVRTLAEETGEPVDDTMTKAEASAKIDELRGKSDRVAGGDRGTSRSRKA